MGSWFEWIVDQIWSLISTVLGWIWGAISAIGSLIFDVVLGWLEGLSLWAISLMPEEAQVIMLEFWANLMLGTFWESLMPEGFKGITWIFPIHEVVSIAGGALTAVATIRWVRWSISWIPFFGTG